MKRTKTLSSIAAIMMSLGVMSASAQKTETFTVNGVTFDMIFVECGSFNMGSDSADAFVYEKPVHKEFVRSFYIGQTEVTQQLWTAVMGSNPSETKGDNLPVENVSWNDCKKFVRELYRLTGRKFRLPTEPEWEYAARGGAHSGGYIYPGGDNADQVAWTLENASTATHVVGTKAPNELEIYDMGGNVAEWTSDYWCDKYKTLRTSSQLVTRGGSCATDATGIRSTDRASQSPQSTSRFLGLRLAL